MSLPRRSRLHCPSWPGVALHILVNRSNAKSSPLYPESKPGEDSQLEQFKKLLVELETKYTPKHPDILAVKRKIADLEQKTKREPEEGTRDKQDFGATLILKAGDTIIVP